MPARPSELQPTSQPSAARPSAAAALQAGVEVMQPLLRLLLGSGVNYTVLSAALKSLCIEQAAAELERLGRKPTDSAISLLSGVHRKDVRAWRESGRQLPPAAVPLPTQVFARWVHDPQYADAQHQPRALPRSGAAPSFETLVQQLTTDVHPYTVLGELLRLGQVSVESRDGEDWVVPQHDAFMPPAGSQEQLALFASNLAAHVSTAVDNVHGAAPQLEQAVFAEGLRAESVAHLHQLARQLWSQMRASLVAEATRRYAEDRRDAQAVHNMRVGVYFAGDPSRSGGREVKE